MLVLVLGANFLMLFVGWEGVGLCSYLLIGYDYHKKFAADAGKKAFVVNRIGDFGFILGIFGVFALFGSLDFVKVFGAAAGSPSAYTPYLTADLPSPVRRRVRQVRAVPALRLAAGRHGRADAGLRADPRRHDGHGRRLHGRPLQRVLPPGPAGHDRRRRRRRLHGALRRHDRARAERHQEGPGVLDGLAARLHVPGLRRRRLHRGHVPRHDARLLQGLSLPRRGLRDPRARAESRTSARWAASPRRSPRRTGRSSSRA